MAAVTREQLHATVDALRDNHLEAAQQALDRLASGDNARRRALVIQGLRDDGVSVSAPRRLSADERRELHERPSITLAGETIAETVVKNRERDG